MNLDRIRAHLQMLMDAKKTKYTTVSRGAGLSHTAVRDLMTRTDNPGLFTLDRIFSYLGSSFPEFICDEYGSQTHAVVPVVGTVGAGGMVMPFDSLPLIPRNLSRHEREELNCQMAPAPGGSYPDGVVALKVTGTSMLPFMAEGSIVYYSDRTIGGASPQALNRQCVVMTPDGCCLLKVVRKSHITGRFDLISFNMETIPEQELIWCAPVIFIKPA
jgi:hypothetical protein